MVFVKPGKVKDFVGAFQSDCNLAPLMKFPYDSNRLAIFSDKYSHLTIIPEKFTKLTEKNDMFQLH